MAELEELDLTKPGKLWAMPEYETTTTFHYVVPKPEYTKDKLVANPQIAPADEIMDPFVVQHNQLDAQGRAVLDLEKTGRAKAMIGKLEQRMQANQRLDVIRAVILASAADGNHIPDKQAVETIDFNVAAIPTITLLGKTIYVTVQNFKGGTKEFIAELKTTAPLKEVKVSVEPGTNIMASTGQNGNGALVLPVKEGQTITLRIPVKFDSTAEERQVMRIPQPGDYRTYVPGGWRTNMGDNNPDRYMDVQRQEIWKGVSYTLKVTGTGPYEGIVKTVQLRAEDWAAGWLWKNPPRVLGHNVC